MENNNSASQFESTREHSKYFLYIAILFVVVLIVSYSIILKLFQVAHSFYWRNNDFPYHFTSFELF